MTVLRTASAIGVLAALAMAAPVAAQSQVPQSREQIMLSFAPVVRKAAPAVVNIYTQTVVERRVSPFAGDPFFERFFGRFGGIRMTLRLAERMGDEALRAEARTLCERLIASAPAAFQEGMRSNVPLYREVLA